jgi:serine/threonine protein kinase
MEADVWSIGVITYILLCGSRPFWARSESGIFRAVLRAEPNFDDAPWPSISPEAKDFVKRLLNKDLRKRMSAAQALSHPWLCGKHVIPLDILVYKRVKAYLRYLPLKRAALKMNLLAFRKMNFEEFCAAATSVYQLEALDHWEEITRSAFAFFEQQGNRVISVEELAQELNLGPNVYAALHDWIRHTDGKLSFFGFTKFLHGVTLRSNMRTQCSNF